MRKVLLTLFSFFTFLLIVAQPTKSWEQWKTDLDAYLAGSGSRWVEAALVSSSGGDSYFEGFVVIMGLQRAWQASGDFKYLDKALDIIEFDMAHAVNTLELYTANGQQEGVFYTPKLDYLSMVQLPNFYKAKNIDVGSYFNPPLQDFINQNTQQQYSYNYFEATGARFAYRTHVLDENIYFRYIADLCRVVYNNPSVLSIVSGNGENYQTRVNRVVEYIEKNIWEKWVESVAQGTSQYSHLNAFVYRNNTHMSSHLASVAVSLYAIRGEQKYLEFINDFLYDFGSAGFNPVIPAGQGFMDQLETTNTGALIYSHKWGDLFSQGGKAQDISHAGPEYNFLIQCFEEGVGLNPEDSNVMAIDQDLIQSMILSMTQNVINGDPNNSTAVSYYIDGSRAGWWNKNQLAQGLYDMAQFSPEVLRFVENNTLSSQMSLQSFGHAMYAARVLGIDGASPPVYPSNGVGNGFSPDNNAPNVILNGASFLELNLGDTYEELGARWNDIQDGEGDLPEPTNGTVNTDVAGDYILEYRYTDEGGLSDIAVRQVRVVEPQNACPVVESAAGNNLLLELGDTYTELGATWTDEEDGTGTATISGDTVDTNQEGVYTIEYSYTDNDGCTGTDQLTVQVYDPSQAVLIESFRWIENSIRVEVGTTFLPEFEVLPQNPTVPYIWVQVDDESLARVDANGFIEALRPGIIQVTGTTLDGTELTDTIEIEIYDDFTYMETFNWDQETYTMEVGERSLPGFTYTPQEVTTPFIWVQSTNTDIIQIDSNGFLIARQVGTVVISGTSLDGTELTDTIIVEVLPESFPSVSGLNASGNEGDNLTFDILLSKAYSDPIVVNLSINHLTTSSADLTLMNQQVTFAPGETQKLVVVNAIVDGIQEGDEFFELLVSGVSPAEFEPVVLQGSISARSGDNGTTQNLALNLAPNPAQSLGVVSLFGFEPGTYVLNVYHLSGGLVHEEQFENISGQASFTVPAVPNGVYIVRLTGLNNSYVQKLLVN